MVAVALAASGCRSRAGRWATERKIFRSSCVCTISRPPTGGERAVECGGASCSTAKCPSDRGQPATALNRHRVGEQTLAEVTLTGCCPVSVANGEWCPSRLWIKCSIAGCDARRPWKTSAFPPGDRVEKVHGGLFPRAARRPRPVLAGGRHCPTNTPAERPENAQNKTQSYETCSDP